MARLRQLTVVWPVLNLEGIVGATSLQELKLSSVPKSIGLGFVERLEGLQRFSLMLGGREELGFAHPRLADLEVMRVRGLAALLPERFPGLSKLRIDDQIRLETLALEGCPGLGG
jgi:hypothetical protein